MRMRMRACIKWLLKTFHNLASHSPFAQISFHSFFLAILFLFVFFSFARSFFENFRFFLVSSFTIRFLWCWTRTSSMFCVRQFFGVCALNRPLLAECSYLWVCVRSRMAVCSHYYILRNFVNNQQSVNSRWNGRRQAEKRTSTTKSKRINK